MATLRHEPWLAGLVSKRHSADEEVEILAVVGKGKRCVSALAVGALIASSGLSASAATAVPPRRAVRATLVQLAGAGACVAQNPKLHNCQQTKALIGASDVAVSPDGNQVYVASRGDQSGQNGGISVFARNHATGRLTGIGCATTSGTNGQETTNGQCADGDGLAGLNSVVVSPDGKNVYATAQASNAIDVFRRDRASGQLTQLACLQHHPPLGSRCIGELPLSGPTDIVVSADGRFVYVSTSTAFFSGVVTYARDPDSGALTDRGCISNDGNDGICATGPALDHVNGLAITGDGATLYAAGGRDAARGARFTRDPATGVLAESGCLSSDTIADSVCANAATMPGADLVAEGASSIAVSPNGDTVYVGLPVGAIVWGEGLSIKGCITFPGSAAANVCAISPGLYEVSRLAVSPDGQTVYATDTRNDSLVSLRRARDGQLSAGSCIAPDQEGCSPARGVSSPLGIAVSPDSTNVYVAAQDSNAVTVFGPSLSIAPARVRVLSERFAVTLTCPVTMPRACSGDLRVMMPGAHRRGQHRARGRPAAHRRYTVGRGKTRRVHLTLARRLRTRLAEKGRLVLVVQAVQRHRDRRATTRLMTVTR